MGEIKREETLNGGILPIMDPHGDNPNVFSRTTWTIYGQSVKAAIMSLDAERMGKPAQEAALAGAEAPLSEVALAAMRLAGGAALEAFQRKRALETMQTAVPLPVEVRQI